MVKGFVVEERKLTFSCAMASRAALASGLVLPDTGAVLFGQNLQYSQRGEHSICFPLTVPRNRI